MLIVNDAHLCLAGRSSLEERCHYCKKPLAAYPLVMSDDAKQTVYHVTCALDQATDLDLKSGWVGYQYSLTPMRSPCYHLADE